MHVSLLHRIALESSINKQFLNPSRSNRFSSPSFPLSFSLPLSNSIAFNVSVTVAPASLRTEILRNSHRNVIARFKFRFDENIYSDAFETLCVNCTMLRNIPNTFLHNSPRSRSLYLKFNLFIVHILHTHTRT